MGLFSTTNLFGMTIRESANDGSDFTNPDADYRRLFLGEDGILHLKDSAGTVTALGDVATHAGAADPHTGYVLESLFDAKGDLISASADNTPAKVTVGTNGYHLIADSAQSAGLAWQAQFVTINFIIDGGGSAITTGVKGYIEVPFAGTITAVTTLLDQSGSIVVDIWKDTYANYPPVDADSITSATPPTVSSATKSQDTTLSSWTTAITANDILGFNVDSATTTTRATIALRVRRGA